VALVRQTQSPGQATLVLFPLCWRRGAGLSHLARWLALRYLRSHYGIQPLHLFASGRGAPQVPDPEPPIHALPQAQFVRQVRDYNGTPEEVLRNAELMELFVPILRADFQINETYVYTPGLPLDCPITAFAGLDDRRFSHEAVRAWREQTRASFSFQVFPGSHFFMHSAQALVLRAVAQGLSEYLRTVSA
jgi:medium-chain acyl-[acyl-carrier-protein] hydrolase